MESRIKELLLGAKSLAPVVSLKIDDFGDACGLKFAIQVESAAFKDLPLIKQHRLVNEVLAPVRPEIHALTIASLPPPPPSSSAVKTSTANAISPGMTSATQIGNTGSMSLCISTPAAVTALQVPSSSKVTTLSTITPPSSADCSGGSSSVGSHSPMMPTYRSSTEDIQSSTMMMTDAVSPTEDESKYWHLGHQDAGYPSPQNGGKGIDDPRVLMLNDDGVSPSLTYHRTCSTPNIHYSFSPETSSLNGGMGISSHRRFAGYYQQPFSGDVGLDSSRFTSSNGGMPMMGTTSSTHSGAAAGYSPLAFTHEQQAQYLYALYHQQLQAQVKEEQAQRLMMYGSSGFPQDSLMYYAGGRQPQSTMESPTSTSMSKANNGSTSSSPTSHSPTIATNTSPRTQQEMLAMGLQTGNQHARYQHFRGSVEPSVAASSSSSSSGINTPPNSGSMSFTSSPATSSITPSKEGVMMPENSSTGVASNQTMQLPSSSTPGNASSLFNIHHMPYSFYTNTGSGASQGTSMMGGGCVPQQQQHYGGSQFSAATAPYFGTSRGTVATQQHPQAQLLGGYHPQHGSAIHSMAHHPMLSVAHHHQANAVASATTIKICSNCGCTSTPSWRRCPTGKQLLCNACGLYQKLHNKPRPFCVLDDGSVKVQRNAFLEATRCGHCNTTETPLWRRGSNGQSLCNACGLYFKQHRQYRPSLPNTGWLSTGGYDAEIMGGSSSTGVGAIPAPSPGMAASSSPAYQHYQHHQTQSSLHHQPPPTWLVSGTTASHGGGGGSNNGNVDGTSYSSSSSSLPSTCLILDSDTGSTGGAGKGDFNPHAHLPSPPENRYTEDPLEDDASAMMTNGTSSVGTTSISMPTHGHHMMLATHTMSAEDEAAVSALAEQMLDAQELFTREEDPSVLAAVAAAAKIHHFERGGMGFTTSGMEEPVVEDPASC